MGDYPIRQLILHTRILVGWFSWELNPGVFGSFWLKASVMGRRAVPLFSLCPGIRLTTAKKTPHFNWLTVFKEIISVYGENHTKHINTL
jgi:hypothetical protein